jgi:hypothetical protein
MSQPLRNPKHEKFARAIAVDGKDPAQAYVDAGFQRDRANHWKLLRNPRVKERVAELMAARVAGIPVGDMLIELEKQGLERVANFYQTMMSGGLVVRDLRTVKREIALALLVSLHDGFGIGWDQPPR